MAAARPLRIQALSRVLFVGLGAVGQRHLRNLRALVGDAVAVDAYRVRREQTVLDDQLTVIPDAKLEAHYRIQVFSELEKALDRRPDIVFVTNPSSFHLKTAIAAARAGADLLIEKPLSDSMAGVEELIAVVAQKHLVAMVAYQMRRHPGFLLLKRRLEEGAVGRPLSVRAEVGEYLPGFHPYEDYRRTYTARRELGGGVTLSQIHELDYLIALFGPPRRAFALGGKVSSLEIDVDDLSSALVEFGAPDGNPLAVELHQDFFQRPTNRRCIVMGERGRLEWSLSDRNFRRWDASGAVVEEVDYASFPRNQAFIDELSYFLGCVKERRQPDVGVTEGASSLRLALGLLRSRASGMPVQFSEETSS